MQDHEILRHEPKVEVQEVTRHVPAPQVQVVEKVVEVPQVRQVEKVMEVPQIQIQEVVRHVPKTEMQEVVRHVLEIEPQVVEKIVEVPRVQQWFVDVPPVQVQAERTTLYTAETPTRAEQGECFLRGGAGASGERPETVALPECSSGGAPPTNSLSEFKGDKVRRRLKGDEVRRRLDRLVASAQPKHRLEEAEAGLYQSACHCLSKQLAEQESVDGDDFGKVRGGTMNSRP